MSDESREHRLQTILHAYLQAIDRGEMPDRQEILDAHPDLRDELAEYIADASKLDQMAKSLRTASFGGDASDASSALYKIRYFGDYELLEEIARGGMGIVFKAKQVSLNRIVALKMILKGELATEADVRRFRHEAEAAANLDHPNIVPIYEVGQHEGQQYFSMKLIELAPAAGGADKNDCRTAACRLAKVARAVHHAHQRGILHRDLKPSNILIDTKGEPHVADFGLAKKVDGSDDATKTGAIVGTPAYMAPEQARAEKSLTTAVDVYSLGAILYEWLTGRPPFRGDNPLATLQQVVGNEPVKPRSITMTIDRDLETICLKCLEKEPVKRYPSTAALADDLDRWQRGEPITARAVGRIERAWRWSKRQPAKAIVLVAIVAAVGWLGGKLVIDEVSKRLQLARDDEWRLYRLREWVLPLIRKLAREEHDHAHLARGLAFDCGALDLAFYLRDSETEKQLREEMQQWSKQLPVLRSFVTGEHRFQGSYDPGPASLSADSKYAALTFGAPGDQGSATLGLFDLAANRRINSPLAGDWKGAYGFPAAAQDPSISPDGKTYAARVVEGIRFVDRATGKFTSPLLSGGKFINCGTCAFRPDGKTLVAGCNNGIQQWDVATNKLVGLLPQVNVEAIHFSPDGQRMATLSHFGDQDQVYLWDLATSERICKELQPKRHVERISFSPDGRWLLLILHDFPSGFMVEWRNTTTGATPGWNQSLPRAVRRILDDQMRFTIHWPEVRKESMLVSADLKNILMVNGHDARLWEILPPEGPRIDPAPPFPVNGSLDDIRSWVEAFTGIGSPPLDLVNATFDPREYTYWLDHEIWASRRRQWTKHK